MASHIENETAFIDYEREMPYVQTSKKTIKYVNSKFKFHSFSIKTGEQTLTGNVIKMNNSIFLWIGNKNQAAFSDLSLAMSADRPKELISTKLMGPRVDVLSEHLAARLASKLKKQVFVSCNIEHVDELTLPLIEKYVSKEINDNPDYF